MKTWILLLAAILLVGCEPIDPVNSVDPKQRPLTRFNIKRVVRDRESIFLVYYETNPGEVQCRRWYVPTFLTDVSEGEPNYVTFDGNEVKDIHLHSVAEIEEVGIIHEGNR